MAGWGLVDHDPNCGFLAGKNPCGLKSGSVLGSQAPFLGRGSLGPGVDGYCRGPGVIRSAGGDLITGRSARV